MYPFFMKIKQAIICRFQNPLHHILYDKNGKDVINDNYCELVLVAGPLKCEQC